MDVLWNSTDCDKVPRIIWERGFWQNRLDIVQWIHFIVGRGFIQRREDIREVLMVRIRQYPVSRVISYSEEFKN